jgi:hypothetical protein
MQRWVFAAALFFHGCGSGSTSLADYPSSAELSAADFFRGSFGLSRAERTAAVAPLQGKTFRQWYDEILPQLNNREATIAGVTIRGARDLLAGRVDDVKAIDEAYADIGAFWRAQKFDPGADVSAADLTAALQALSAKALTMRRSAPATAAVGLIDQSQMCALSYGASVGGMIGTCLGAGATFIAAVQARRNCQAASAEARQRPADLEMQTRHVVVENPGEGDIAVGTTTYALPPAPRATVSPTKVALKSAAAVATVTAFTGASIAAAVWGYSDHSCNNTSPFAPAPAPGAFGLR